MNNILFKNNLFFKYFYNKKYFKKSIICSNTFISLSNILSKYKKLENQKILLYNSIFLNNLIFKKIKKKSLKSFSFQTKSPFILFDLFKSNENINNNNFIIFPGITINSIKINKKYKTDVLYFLNPNLKTSILSDKLLYTNKIFFGGEIINFNKKNILFNLQINIYFQILNIYTNQFLSLKWTLIFIHIIITESLVKTYKKCGIVLPKIFFEIISKKMTSYIKITKSNLLNFSIGDIILIKTFELILLSHINNTIDIIEGKPIILKLTEIQKASLGFLSSSSFQKTLHYLTKISFDIKTDWLSDIKSQIISSSKVSFGSGWNLLFSSYN